MSLQSYKAFHCGPRVVGCSTIYCFQVLFCLSAIIYLIIMDPTIVPHTVFPRFLPTGTFSAHQDAGTIRGRKQNEGGVNITRQRMPSRVLARVCSVRHEVLVAASNEHSCLSRDFCCSISAATPPGFTVH